MCRSVKGCHYSEWQDVSRRKLVIYRVYIRDFRRPDATVCVRARICVCLCAGRRENGQLCRREVLPMQRAGAGRVCFTVLPCSMPCKHVSGDSPGSTYVWNRTN